MLLNRSDLHREIAPSLPEHHIHTLEMVNIWKQFPDVIANHGINLSLQPGEVHALLGENGAGKTTLMKILSGYYRPDAGSILLNGKRVDLSSPAEAMRAGIGMVHQHFHLIEAMTAAENIHMGWSETPWLVSDQVLTQRMQEINARFGMQVDPQARVWQLSVGEQQRVEILRVLARGAKVIILDEPTAVLTPQEANELFHVMRALAESGRIVVFISHKLDEVCNVSDKVSVLRKGRLVETCETCDCTPRSLARLMMGYDLIPRLERDEAADRKGVENVVLELQGISALNDRLLPALKDFNLKLKSGEILGIAGVAGNGQRELAELIGGLRPAIQGRMLVKGVDRTNASPAVLAQEGVGHVPEDRYNMGLVLEMSVTENAIMRNYQSPPISRHGFLNATQAETYTKALVEEGDVRTPSLNAPVRNLSGGNQQKLLVTREMHTATSLLVAVHPTRGLDVAATENVRKFLMKYRNEGGGVLLISEDLDEVLLMSDRILVMYEGQIMGEFDAAEVDIEEIGLLMGGKHAAKQKSAGRSGDD